MVRTLAPALLLPWFTVLAAVAAGTDRGGHFAIALVASELDAPRQTSTTDLDLFEGLGLDLAGGYRTGHFRFEAELHFHDSSRLYTGDSVGVNALMLNAYVDLPVGGSFGFFVGGGVGLAAVDVQFSTCLDHQGCPAGAYTSASRSTVAYQYMVGFGWLPSPRRQLFVSLRWFRSGDLDLADSLGNSFADDYVSMPMAVIGYMWRFGQRTAQTGN